VMQRLYHVVLAGEIAGPEEARRQLDALDRDLRAANHKPTPAEERLRDILTRLYGDYARGRLDRPSLTAADRTFLRAELGWFGALALAPAGPGLSGPVLGVAGGCGLAAAF